MKTMRVCDLPAAKCRGMGNQWDEVLLVMSETRAACVPIKGENARTFRSRIYSIMKYHGVHVRTRVDPNHEILYVWLQKKGKKR